MKLKNLIFFSNFINCINKNTLPLTSTESFISKCIVKKIRDLFPLKKKKIHYP